MAALANLRRLCEEHLAGQYTIEIIDLMEHPDQAQRDQILAIPTLVRRLPEPIKRIIGDLSNSERVLVGLEVHARPLEARLMAAGSDSPPATYVLRLYIAGTTARSMRAVEHVRGLCEAHLAGHYDLEVVDVYQQPELAAREQLFAAPTLVKKLPLPLRRLVGDMSNHERVLAGLDVVVVPT